MYNYIIMYTCQLSFSGVKNGSGAVDAKTSENSGVMATAPIIPSILLSLVALLTAYISCAC